MICPQLTTLAFVLHPDGERVLMVHRTARPDDDQLGKYNGLGGKVERDEDVAAGMKRELREEARLEVDHMSLAGTVSWPGFNPDGSDQFGFVFVVDAWHGDIPPANEEGPLAWERIDRLGELDMWEGDRYFVPLVLDPDVPQFHAVIPYENGRPTGARWTVLP
ncbi:putative mutator MutT protein [Propionibacterium acidifaciens F0233]|uniref:Mutator MutT protein n=1 Tax=Propionibacterium acidifaciens F0233 TaxID=553198 RepID=U2QDP1_9ACTN|nr:8-oxo-dGTP diphosphatase [Propionibacterium acidifaciens]AYW77093.1 8-oxo-dGTP diphosphatase [Propionibacterium acidifaciens]ERK60965.1 putative mutator MutT protein [Propionibacterium acidifaciens F0233]